MSAKKAKKTVNTVAESGEVTEVKKSKTGTVVIVFLILIIIVGGVGGWFYIQNIKSSAPQEKQIKQTTIALNEMIVNLSDEGGKKYVKANISIGYDTENKNLGEELKNNSPIFRDSAISILRSKQSKDLDAKGMEDLKKQLTDSINSSLKEGRILNVYFTDFVIQ